MSIVPDLVHNEHLLMANSLLTTTGMIAFVLGCSLGGFLVDHVGARGGFIIDAATFFLAGILVFSMARPFPRKFNQTFFKTGKEPSNLSSCLSSFFVLDVGNLKWAPANIEFIVKRSFWMKLRFPIIPRKLLSSSVAPIAAIFKESLEIRIY